MASKDWGKTAEEIKANLDKANIEFLKEGAATEKDHKDRVKELETTQKPTKI